MTVVVSEESGMISLCVRGEVHRDLDREQLGHKLRSYYTKTDEAVEEKSESKQDKAPSGGEVS